MMAQRPESPSRAASAPSVASAVDVANVPTAETVSSAVTLVKTGRGMATTDAMVQAVKAFILDEFLPGEPADSLAGDTPLISGGILDSIATLKLVMFLEEKFGVVLAAHEVDKQYLDTLDDIAKLLASKQR